MPFGPVQAQRDIAETEKRIGTLKRELGDSEWRLEEARRAYDEAVRLADSDDMRRYGTVLDSEEGYAAERRVQLNEARTAVAALQETYAEHLLNQLSPEQRQALLDRYATRL